MKTARRRTLAAVVLSVICVGPLSAQTVPHDDDTRTQYPWLLRNSFFSVSLGGIDYEFSSQQLSPGEQVGTVLTPHPAARIGLFGHEFNRFLSAQATYMRPASFVAYDNVNGDQGRHHVWMALGAVTVKGRVPLTSRLDVYGEGGLGITSRHGFSAGRTDVVPDVHYASGVFGTGADYRLTHSWDLVGGMLWAPGRSTDKQSPTFMTSMGFQYTMRPLATERARLNAQSGFRFPVNVIQIETTGGYGYGVNTFFAKSVPIFWDGNVRVDRGEAIHVVRNVFHTARVFGFDVGASGSVWRSQADRSSFYTVSVYPQFRFVFLRTGPADVWAVYSLAGPTYISRSMIDGQALGTRFTFQDFMGVGMFVGATRRVSLGVKINHYSNGNMFTQNAAVTVPITFNMGYAF